ncbi:MAG: helix-turn-helix transcriptional regulator [Anaerobutyricum sp.]
MDIFGDAVSARYTGNFSSTDAPKESYEVGDLAPDNVDFGVRISGDSMEPEYYNRGNCMDPAKRQHLQWRRVGIFYLNGDAYVKNSHDEPGWIVLTSPLNKKYKTYRQFRNRTLFKIFGRVVGKCDASDIPGFQ